MNPSSFDRLSRLLAERRLTRRGALHQALAIGGAGLAATALGTMSAGGQDATLPAETAGTPAPGAAATKTAFLFVQSFQQGAIGPKTGKTGTYQLTLEQGLGQTVYFSDRPERIVGAVPTGQFLKGMNFTPDNPPNAALVVEAAPGDEDIAVVELTNPSYDTATKSATYDVKALADWQETLAMGFQEEPTDLAGFDATFGAAHLLIDDCADGAVGCFHGDGTRFGNFTSQGFCWHLELFACIPCAPFYQSNPDNLEEGTEQYWSSRCNTTFSACGGTCVAYWSD